MPDHSSEDYFAPHAEPASLFGNHVAHLQEPRVHLPKGKITMKTICKDCHHAPSGRTAEYGAACQCSCHDVADAAPALLEACEALVWRLPDLGELLSGRQGVRAAEVVEMARAAIALTRSH